MLHVMFHFTNRLKAINSWKRTLFFTHCFAIGKHSTEHSFANLGIKEYIEHCITTVYFVRLSPRSFRVSWKPVKSVKIQYV